MPNSPDDSDGLDGVLDAALDAAERAAGAGDYAAAERSLREAVALQEATLGHSHPDLANTLNNLGVVCERAGQLREAELCYRRAHGIVTRALPPTDPLVATAEDNLRQFCAATGIPFVVPDPISPVDAAPTPLVGVPAITAADPPIVTTPSSGPAKAAEAQTRIPAPTTPPPSRAADAQKARRQEGRKDRGVRHVSTSGTPAPVAGSRRGSTAIGLVASGVVGLAVVLVWLFGGQSTNAPAEETAAPGATASPATASAGAASPESPAAAASPTTPGRPEDTPRTVAPGSAQTTVATAAGSSAAGGAATEPVTLLRASLCGEFETVGTPDWRCVAASNNEPTRRLVFYTRLSAPRATTVEHRWYLNDTMRQQVPLRVPPSGGNGYRTYSAASATSGTWRVELRDIDGKVLHEQRVTVP